MDFCCKFDRHDENVAVFKLDSGELILCPVAIAKELQPEGPRPGKKFAVRILPDIGVGSETYDATELPLDYKGLGALLDVLRSAIEDRFKLLGIANMYRGRGDAARAREAEKDAQVDLLKERVAELELQVAKQSEENKGLHYRLLDLDAWLRNEQQKNATLDRENQGLRGALVRLSELSAATAAAGLPAEDDIEQARRQPDCGSCLGVTEMGDLCNDCHGEE